MALIALVLLSTWRSACGVQPDAPPTTQPAGSAIAAPQGEMTKCLSLIRSGKTDEARQRLVPVLAQHPNWPRANFMLAMTFHTEKRYGQARPLFAKALDLDPRDHVIRIFYGWCLYYLGDAKASTEMFESYLKVNPNYPDALFAMGLLDLDRDDLLSAKKRFEKAIEVAAAAKDADAEGKSRARLADLFIRTNDLEKARTQLEMAVRLKPDAYSAYHKLSRVLERHGDHAGAARAREMFKKVRAEFRRNQTDTARPEMQ